LTDYEKSKPLIELKDKRIFELVSEKDGEFEYVLTPSVIQVNSDSEIDKNLSAAGFHSTYTVNREILDILIYEYYYKTNLPITAYNDFKNVIKAAADFNKGKIILTKK